SLSLSLHIRFHLEFTMSRIVPCAKSLKATYSDRTRSLKFTHLPSIRNCYEGGDNEASVPTLTLVSLWRPFQGFRRQTWSRGRALGRHFGALRGRAPGFGSFVDAQDQRLVGRIEIEPDHVLHLGGEILVARDLEGLDQVQRGPVGTPDPLNTAVG